jgi:hypothetical protein
MEIELTRLIEREIQFENVDSSIAENSKLWTFGVLPNEVTHVFLA